MTEPNAAAIDNRVERLLADTPPDTTEAPAFFAAQFDAGLAFVHLPAELGGCMAPRGYQARVTARLRTAGARSAGRRNPIGVGLALPTIERHGTAEQKLRYFRPAFTGAEIWCQLFSEPGAGSDLAGLATRAHHDSGQWRVTGQKVWTSMAHVAQRGLLLARTEPDRPKHHGLTMFVLDMDSAGLEVRPLRQITGEAEFNEVFLTDVLVPDANRIGERGDGWAVARTTLTNERVMHGGDGAGLGTVGGSGIDRLLARARAVGVSDAALRDRLAGLYVDGLALRAMNRSARAAMSGAARTGAAGAISKHFQGLYNQRLQQAAADLLGVAQVAWDEGDDATADVVRGYLRSQGNTIEGGTTNILRNIIAERALGFARDPGPAADTPWNELRRNA